MPFDALRQTDDPGLNPHRLAAGDSITPPSRRRNPWPERAMAAIQMGFWAALGFVVIAVAVALS